MKQLGVLAGLLIVSMVSGCKTMEAAMPWVDMGNQIRCRTHAQPLQMRLTGPTYYQPQPRRESLWKHYMRRMLSTDSMIKALR